MPDISPVQVFLLSVFAFLDVAISLGLVAARRLEKISRYDSVAESSADREPQP